MKKIAVVLVASLALTMAVPALATEVILKDGKLSGGFTINNGDTSQMNPKADAQVKLAAAANEEGGWSAEAELGNLIGTPKLEKYKVEFQDPLFRLTAWGKGKEIASKNDPFSFVKSNGKHAGTLKVRAEVAPVTVDVDDDSNLHLFAEQMISNHTLGIAAHTDLPLQDGITAVGYGKTSLSDVALTGAVGVTMKEGATDENIGYGVKAEAPIIPGVTAAVTYKSEPINFINARNRDELKVEGKHEAALVRLSGSFAHAVKSDTREMDNQVIEAVADWRGSDQNQGWDNQFKNDKYSKNVAPAVQAKVTQTRDGSQPTNELTVKGTMPVIPGRVWVNGQLKNVADADASLEAKVRNLANSEDIVLTTTGRHTTVQTDGFIQATEKLSVEPGMLYMNAADADYLKLGAKAGYQIAPSGKLTAEYAQDYVSKETHDSRLGLGYEVKF